MRRRHIAVVGASLGGLRTVEALRRLGNDARITLVGAEPHLPYDRPPLSKEILLGKAEPASAALTSAAALADLDIEVHLDTRATGLDLATRELVLDDVAGERRLAVDEVVVATGSTARRPAGLGDLDGICTLRTTEDAAAIRGAFESGARVVVLGGGFIGAEVASAAIDLGLEVSIVDVAGVLMERGLGQAVGARMSRIALDAGVRLHLGRGLDRVEGRTRVEGVTLTDGTRIEADLLVLGVGAAPAAGWLDGSGLTLTDGVACDQYLAAAPGVHAVGDVARWQHPRYGSVRMEHWTTATEHADAVAATLTGRPTVAAEIPYVWSDQFGHKLQVAGRLGPQDEVRFVTDTVSDDGHPKFLAVAGSPTGQSAAFALNAPGPLVRQRMKLAAGQPWPPEDPIVSTPVSTPEDRMTEVGR